jgi:peroxiredoxin
MIHYALAAGSDIPKMAVSKVGGGEIQLGCAPGWQVLVIYRGKHCPICRTYLKTLNALLDRFAEIGVEVAAISADTAEKAETEAKEEGWLFPVGHSLTLDQMRALGLYVSNPRSAEETDRPFPEPGFWSSIPKAKFRSSTSRMRRLRAPILTAS